MKFAKDLEREMVPEWRAKYMNYKQAKKRLRIVERLYKATHPASRGNGRAVAFVTPIFGRQSQPDSTRQDGPSNADSDGAPLTKLPTFELPAAAISDNATIATLGTQPVQTEVPKGRPGSSAKPRMSISTPRHVLGMLSEKMGTTGSPATPATLQRQYSIARQEFIGYLESQLDTVDSFFVEKEAEAIARLPVLREQLHLMRDRRLEDLKIRRARKNKTSNPGRLEKRVSSQSDETDRHVGSQIRTIMTSIAPGRVGKNSKALEAMATPHALDPVDPMRDYSRKQHGSEVPYRVAKRKLKTALQEYHRSLDLLKSYSLINHTAFRKINKKFDKLTNNRPSLHFLTDRVAVSHFVTSDQVDRLMEDVEDLYTRYFERGSHKVAVAKLRSRAGRSEQFNAVLLLNGLLIGTGAFLSVDGLLKALTIAHDEDTEPQTVADTHYLLQIYGGYFLISLLSLLFCFACWFWTESKINYVFVFEFDPRTRLDWRQLFVIPSVCFSLLGVFSWINFSQWGSPSLYIWYPVILVSVTMGLLLNPFRMFYHRARWWFLYACWRLFFSGFYPVEFRDFFLGDMFCSQIYSMSNIALFFCLYSTEWDDPGDCNSNHSRLMGFFATLPAIWRTLQCIRRYWDTRNAFPHLANCGKYVFNILTYMSLNLYRIGKSPEEKAMYIVFAAINTIYSTVWDLLMDWSLLDFASSNFMLRDTLGYKSKWIYYLAIVLDPPLRSVWVFYVIFPLDIQHSATMAYMLGFAEVARRGMWIILRIENEHCSNVGRFRASRDIPLPYSVRHSGDDPTGSTTDMELAMPGVGSGQACRSRRASPQVRAEMSPVVRTLSHVAHHFHTAHTEDFVRRKDTVDRDRQTEPVEEDDSDDDGMHLAGNVTPAQDEDSMSIDPDGPVDRRSRFGRRPHAGTSLFRTLGRRLASPARPTVATSAPSMLRTRSEGRFGSTSSGADYEPASAISAASGADEKNLGKELR